MVKPITPDDVHEQMLNILPDKVIDTWNKMIARNWNDRESHILQSDVVIALIGEGYTRTDIYNKGYLEIEPIYRASGWSVHYDKPGYNEDYEPNFTFTRKKK